MPKPTASTFSRRALLLGAGASVLMGSLATRLGYLQFFKAEEFSLLAESNRIKLQLEVPPRGRLLDRAGEVLAGNSSRFRLLLEVTTRKEAASMLDRIQELVGLERAEVNERLKQVKLGTTLLVKDPLPWDELAKLEFHLPDLPGLRVDSAQLREYPLSQKAAHLLGYLGIPAEEELEEDQPLLRLPDYRIGKQGIEQWQEETLRGTPGVRQMEVNAHGLMVRELAHRESIPGKDVRLTIDRRLQEFVADRVAAESAAVAVLDIVTGGVLALVSMPAFDPNRFNLGIESAYWQSLQKDEKFPLIHKTIAGQYPPGSTFKMLVGLAGLEAGTIHPGTYFSCPGHFDLGNHRFNCWKVGGHGSMNCRSAIAQSCDVFFYNTAQRTGIEPILSAVSRFGLGAATGLPIIGEKPGTFPSPEWKERRFKQPWQAGDTINVSIGQGYMLATPLQMALMTARLASGMAVSPRLLQEEAVANFEPIAIKPEWLSLIRSGMEDVVNTPSGTAYGKRIPEPERAMAGKTGTAQVRRILVRGRDQSTLPWRDRHHAWFVGYAPIASPRFAVCVLIEHGGGGSAAAAPVARDVLVKAQELLGEATA